MLQNIKNLLALSLFVMIIRHIIITNNDRCSNYLINVQMKTETNS